MTTDSWTFMEDDEHSDGRGWWCWDTVSGNDVISVETHITVGSWPGCESCKFEEGTVLVFQLQDAEANLIYRSSGVDTLLRAKAGALLIAIRMNESDIKQIDDRIARSEKEIK